ncbi:MAG: hypothetical protein RSF79_19185, partial [Janthinobacterium sp.]
ANAQARRRMENPQRRLVHASRAGGREVAARQAASVARQFADFHRATCVQYRVAQQYFFRIVYTFSLHT